MYKKQDKEMLEATDKSNIRMLYNQVHNRVHSNALTQKNIFNKTPILLIIHFFLLSLYSRSHFFVLISHSLLPSLHAHSLI